MKIIYVDTIIFDLQHAGGISVYWYEIINRMLVDKEVEPYFIVSDDKKDNIYWDKLNLPQDKVVKYNKLFNRYRSVNYKENRDHVFISSYYRYSKNKHATNITVVHDFTYEYFSGGLRKIVHHWQKMKAIYKSKKSICISKNTQKDLNKFSKRKVESAVVYNGVSDIYRVMSSEEISSAISTFESPIDRIIDSGKYVLFVGQRAGYKNWKDAVKLFKQLSTEYSMLSVGGSELTKEENDLLGNDKNRHYKLSALSEDQLCLLYNKAYCLLYLSEYEGFGIPIVEAEQCGCPSIAMNRSSIPEIAEGSELIHLVDQVDSSPLNLQHGEAVARFSWDKTYKGIRLLINEVI